MAKLRALKMSNGGTIAAVNRAGNMVHERRSRKGGVQHAQRQSCACLGLATIDPLKRLGLGGAGRGQALRADGGAVSHRGGRHCSRGGGRGLVLIVPINQAWQIEPYATAGGPCPAPNLACQPVQPGGRRHARHCLTLAAGDLARCAVNGGGGATDSQPPERLS